MKVFVCYFGLMIVSKHFHTLIVLFIIVILVIIIQIIRIIRHIYQSKLIIAFHDLLDFIDLPKQPIVQNNVLLVRIGAVFLFVESEIVAFGILKKYFD